MAKLMMFIAYKNLKKKEMWALLHKARLMTEPHMRHLPLRLTEPTFQHTICSSITAVVIKPCH